MESCEPQGEEKPNRGLVRYLCKAASGSEVFTQEDDALRSLSTPGERTQAGEKGQSRWDQGFLPVHADYGHRNPSDFLQGLGFYTRKHVELSCLHKIEEMHAFFWVLCYSIRN